MSESGSTHLRRRGSATGNDTRRSVLAVVVAFASGLVLSLTGLFLLSLLPADRRETVDGWVVVPFLVAIPLLVAGLAGTVVALICLLRALAPLGNDPVLRQRVHRAVLRRRDALNEAEMPVAARWASDLVPYFGFELVSGAMVNTAVVLSVMYLVRAREPFGTVAIVIVVLLILVTVLHLVIHGIGLVRTRAFAGEHLELLATGS